MRIFYILLSFILLITVQAKSQARGPLTDPEHDHKVIKFYPNPAVSYITFELTKEPNKSYNLQIFSFLGRKVKEVPDVVEKTTVNLGDLTRGLYTFQLKDESGHVTDSGIFQVLK
jgi:hypothetical protein